MAIKGVLAIETHSADFTPIDGQFIMTFIHMVKEGRRARKVLPVRAQYTLIRENPGSRKFAKGTYVLIFVKLDIFFVVESFGTMGATKFTSMSMYFIHVFGISLPE